MKAVKNTLLIHNTHKKKIAAYMLMACMLFPVVFLNGCGRNDKNVGIVLTTGFSGDEVFKIDSEVCTVPEVMVYIGNLQRQYEKIYGDDIWQKSVGGVTLESNIKDMALADISKTKAVSLMATQKGVTLDEEEQENIRRAAKAYYSSLDEKEAQKLGIKEDTIKKLYGEYALSKKLYESIIKDVNPEISDDEARTITVQQIYFKTFNYDDDGTKTPYDASHKMAVKKTADEVRQRIADGESFETLAGEYSDAEEITVSFGKGETDTAFEVAAFELATDEISDVVETEYGYYIIKCVSAFNKEITDENKLRIVEQRKQEAFDGEYESFVSGLTKKLNDKVWDSITLLPYDNTSQPDFFEVFEEYCE